MPSLEDSRGPFSRSKVSRVRAKILKWGRKNFRDFPWRSDKDPWRTLLAEILLQRTRADQVMPIFLRIQEEEISARKLVASGLALCEDIVKSLGLLKRASQILRIATSVDSYGGFPLESENALRGLIGVGPYTASAWLSLHRNRRASIVDSNVYRWLSRMTGLPYGRDPRHVKWVNNLAEQLTPQRVFRDYNYAVLDFTMSVCMPRSPRCESCPLIMECAFGKSRKEHAIAQNLSLGFRSEK
jgi:A/G-specific adenine glycosylase